MTAADHPILIVEAPFYKDILVEMGESARQVLSERGYSHETVIVPGVYEIPCAVSMALASGRAFAGVVTLGCVIRGETDHYEFISRSALDGLMDLLIAQRVPHGLGILTVENQEQARVRADRQQKDLGGRAALACLEMIDVANSFRKS